MFISLLDNRFKVETTNKNFNKYDIQYTEYILVKNASSKRKIDFINGRICAKNSLSKLGITYYPILIGKHREPLWPPTVVGSITHCENFTAVAAALKKHILSIGIDAELNIKLPCKIITTTQTLVEIEINSKLSKSINNVCINKLVFSAKESVFKFAYPIIKKYIKFQDVEISLNPETKSFSVSFLKKEHSSIFENSKLIGKYDYNNTHIVTCVYELACNEK